MTTHPTTHSTETAELPLWVIISVYLFLLIILAIFGDLLVFIVGFLGITIAFASYYSGSDSHEAEHH